MTGDIWASVSIDATPLETAPFTKPHPVPTGMHSFRFENKNVKLDETVSVMIVPNASLQFKIVKGATSYSIMRVK